MKIKILTLFITFSILISCSKTSEKLNTTIEWQIGHEIPEVIELVSSQASELIHLELNRNSLCDNTGVKITIEQNSIVIFEEEIESLTFFKDIEIQTNSELKITSRIFEIAGNSHICKGLGLANCKITY